MRNLRIDGSPAKIQTGYPKNMKQECYPLDHTFSICLKLKTVPVVLAKFDMYFSSYAGHMQIFIHNCCQFQVLHLM
jgi:hypothetical protein